MSNLAATLIKLAALATGGILGALIARLSDETLSKRATERSYHDKTRYERGLAPAQPLNHQTPLTHDM